MFSAFASLAISAPSVRTQDAPSPPVPASSASSASPATDKPAFKQEELEQMFAPIALYPDALVSQLLMACTYPLEIVLADRWVKTHQDLKGDAAAQALEKESWDASVKSLVTVPDVLAMLSDKLEWTQQLGDAFIGQQKEVMDTIQKLRARAKDLGKLESDTNQQVEVQQQGTTRVIRIQSADPGVVYVPSYDPYDDYGDWPYGAYPPYYYYPPAYAAGAAIAVGLAWGYAWGHCDWNNADIDIDINRNNQLNRFIDKGNYREKLGQAGRGSWRHDPTHRANMPYRNQAATRRFGGRTTAEATQARDAFRGRNVSENRSRPESTNRRGAGGGGSRAATPKKGNVNRGAGKGGSRPAPKKGNVKRGAGAFNGVNRGGQAARDSSSRGWASRGGSSRGGSVRGGRARGRR
jgi:hypothetical protein